MTPKPTTTEDLSGRRIGHIRLERPLGTGGMGSVYLGFDELLERRVAVKVLRGERALDDASKQRFLREARVLSRLDHPSLCRVHDLIEDRGRDYLVMEYVEGRTLTRHAATGIGVRDRLEIVEKVARAVAVAHAERIVHRDLKPDNVMLTGSGEVKILDFGLARLISDSVAQPLVPADEVEGADSADTVRLGRVGSDGMTELGVAVGTIRYMSPEQAAGRPLDEASDVYSLGVVLHELLTGRLPYPEQESDVALLEPIGNGQQDLQGSGDAEVDLLLRDMLALDPGARPDMSSVAARVRWILDRPRRARRRVRRLAGTLSVVGLLALTALLSRSWWLAGPVLDAGESSRVAVLPFVNRTGQASLDWVELGLAEMVARTLATNPQLEVVPVEEVRAVMAGLGLAPGNEPPRADLDRLGEALGCRVLLATSVGEGEALVATATIYDRLGSVGMLRLAGSEPTALVADLAVRLSHRLAPQSLVQSFHETYSDSALANEVFAVGYDRRARAGSAVAAPYFEVCLDLDPELQWARYQLAGCRHDMGRWDEAERLAAEALVGARAAQDQQLTAACLNFLGGVAHFRGQLDRAEQLWREALAGYAATGNRAGEVAVLNNLGVHAFKRGDYAAAEEGYARALRLARESGAQVAVGAALTNLGSLARRRGDLVLADERFREAAQVHRELGLESDLALSLFNLGAVALARGELDRAQAWFEQSLAIRERAGDHRGQGASLEGLAGVAIERGRLDQAEQLLNRALALSRDLGYAEGEAGTLANLAYVATARGDLPKAIELLEQALARAATLGDTVQRSDIARSLAETYRSSGDAERAGAIEGRLAGTPSS